MTSFEMIGVSRPAVGTDALGMDDLDRIDPEDLRHQLEEIRAALEPLLTPADASRLGLTEITVGLTLGASGKILFIAEGSVEATITLTFSSLG